MTQPPCSTMHPETHRVYARLSQSRWHPRTLILRETARNLQQELGFGRWRDFVLHIEDLAQDGLLDWDADSHRIKLLTPCSCGVKSLESSPTAVGDRPHRVEEEPTGEAKTTLGAAEARSGAEGATTADASGRTRVREEILFSKTSFHRPKKTRAPRSTVEIVLYFDSRVSKLRGSSQFGRVGETNRRALGAHIKRWREETGATPELIVEMIDIFVANAKLRDDCEAWRVFISDRTRLQGLAYQSLRERGRLDSAPTDAVRSEVRASGYGGWGSSPLWQSIQEDS